MLLKVNFIQNLIFTFVFFRCKYKIIVLIKTKFLFPFYFETKS